VFPSQAFPRHFYAGFTGARYWCIATVIAQAVTQSLQLDNIGESALVIAPEKLPLTGLQIYLVNNMAGQNLFKYP